MQIYIVKEGDTIDAIAGAAGMDPLRLAFENQIDAPYRLAVGQSLLVTGGGKNGEESRLEGIQIRNEQTGPVIMNGYAYPWIEEAVLTETCRFLTSISIFSYGFTESGELIPPSGEGEEDVIQEAKRQNVIPVLVLTPLGADGRFNNNLVSILVGSLEIQQKLIRELWSVVQEKGYGEVDVDFEYVLAEDRELFADFVRRLRIIMNLFGIRVTVALAPKTSRDQRGLLYEGIDYKALGEAANGVLLMTYEWGYTYGPPMAVAPINMVRRVVEYALTEIPAEKISLGIPNYGYDWPIPYEQGVTRAISIGYTEAIRLAVDHGVRIYFDETAQSPHFRYWQYGIQHEVWFEDVRSMHAKFGLIKEFGLAGTGYWQLMRLFRANWLLADHEFLIQKGRSVI
ncbi:glycosyl hydrolase family 18 protein [[Clostridium] symbiosum]|uniref:glycosyl hydrolase family 18 protein n=1 Tax=Clostridium symbiosum TaxID=1512 RepID=UPI001D09346F|nr:glycosyl hydrolase family 18 protein [[Clostridium] symbiosum]MCB6608489.1 LysM peptidoglycan-binding domain-containing protein [[Clostridium] symbiosum]MCB6932199.1 LysM peptidoglycan-binding domain-containing protein [[Clostridium] symbiosum]